MTLTLRAEIEARLMEEASRQGLDPAEYAGRLIEQGLPRQGPNQATLDLLARWDAEDATDDPEEIARRRREAEEFMQSLARTRVDMEGPNARKLWP